MIARALVVAVAVLALAWLGINLRGYDRFESGQRLALAPNATEASARQAAQLLEDARFLNPDTRPMLAKGSLLVARGGPRALGPARRGNSRAPEASPR